MGDIGRVYSARSKISSVADLKHFYSDPDLAKKNDADPDPNMKKLIKHLINQKNLFEFEFFLRSSRWRTMTTRTGRRTTSKRRSRWRRTTTMTKRRTTTKRRSRRTKRRSR